MGTKIVNIKSSTYNATAFTGLLSVQWDDGIDTAIDNKSDDNLYATAGKGTEASCTGTLTGVDFEVFEGLARGAQETLVFVGCKVSDNTDVTVTISECMLLKQSNSLEHSADGSVSLTFKAYSADGQTSPVIIS